MSDPPLKDHIKNLCLERSKRREKIIKKRSTDERIGEESVSLTQQTAFDWRWQRVEEEEEGGREADGKELIHYASN